MALTPIGPSNPLDHRKDPRGLVRADIEHLRNVFKPRPVTPKMTIQDIMYDAGKQAVIDYIEDKMIGRYG